MRLEKAAKIIGIIFTVSNSGCYYAGVCQTVHPHSLFIWLFTFPRTEALRWLLTDGSAFAQ